MNSWIKSKKYKGVYHRKSKDNEITYYFTYQNEDGKTQYQKIGTKSQGITESVVNELRLKTITSIKLGGDISTLHKRSKKNRVTIDDISVFYFTHKRTKSTEKRQRQYNYRIKPFFGNMSIYDVNTHHLEKFKNICLSEISEHTTNIYMELLSTIYNFYIRKHQLKLKNPVMLVSKVRVDNVRQRFLSKKEIEVLFNEIEHDFTMTLFLSLSLTTGGRKSTIMNYKIKDVDLEHKMINSYDFKNNTSYKSFLDDRTIELIKIRMKQSTNINDSLVYRYDIHDLDRWISRSFKIVLDSLFNIGLDQNDRKNRVVIHTFRHTVLSHLGIKGTSEFIIKKISNHKSTQMVERYVKLNEDSGKKEIQELWS